MPLTIMVWSSLLTEEQGEPERVALTAAVQVGPQFRAGDPVSCPPPRPTARSVSTTSMDVSEAAPDRNAPTMSSGTP